MDIARARDIVLLYKHNQMANGSLPKMHFLLASFVYILVLATLVYMKNEVKTKANTLSKNYVEFECKQVCNNVGRHFSVKAIVCWELRSDLRDLVRAQCLGVHSSS